MKLLIFVSYLYKEFIYLKYDTINCILYKWFKKESSTSSIFQLQLDTNTYKIYATKLFSF